MRLQALLTDPITQLPTLTAKMAEVRAALEESGSVGLIFVTIPRADDLESVYGWQYYDDFVINVSEVLREFAAAHLNPEDLIVVRELQSSELLIFIRCPRDADADYISSDRLDYLRYQLTNFLDERRRPDLLRGHRHITFHTGTARITHNLFARPERLILAAVDYAREAAFEEAKSEILRQKELLKRIIIREEVEVVYQPITTLPDVRIFGFEALSAAAPSSGIEGAEVLFSLADEVNLSTQLDRVCRRRALQSARRWLSHALLFVNTNPQTIEEIGAREDALFHLFQNGGVDPSHVVLEITERSAIGNLGVFEATLNRFRDHGVGVAVDDAGAGYASLNTIARLRPDFLKFDMALVRDIDKDRVKQELLATVQDLARRVNARVIAEGIETEAEFKTLCSFGVDLGQGYYLAKPKTAAEIEGRFPHAEHELLNGSGAAKDNGV